MIGYSEEDHDAARSYNQNQTTIQDFVIIIKHMLNRSLLTPAAYFLFSQDSGALDPYDP